MSEILGWLRERQGEMVRALEVLVMLDSPTHEPELVNGVTGFLADSFGRLGAGVERLPQGKYGDHLKVTWGQGDGQVLLLGHMDTVWPADESKRRPFTVGGGQKATGPGVFDMKGGLVVGLYAVRALHALGLRPAQRLVFLFNSEEEVGSPTSRPIIEAEARRSAAALVLEPSREEALVTWRKGVGRFVLEIEGQASHSGSAHEKGISAVTELAHQVLRLEGMTDPERGRTVNVGMVRGGSNVNVRPAAARAEIDLRVTNAAEARRMEDTILGLEPADPRTRLKVSGGINRPPWEATGRGSVLFERAKRIGARLGMDLWPAGTGGGSDGNFTAALGVPTLDGLGIVGNDAHAVSEWADVSSLPRRAALLAELVLPDLASKAGEPGR